MVLSQQCSHQQEIARKSELTLVSFRVSEPLIGLARTAACSRVSSSSCSPPITGSPSVALPSSVILTLCAILWGFGFDFEITAWLPLFQVATTPFSVVVCSPITDGTIASVMLLARAGETRVSSPLQSLLGCGELQALITDPQCYMSA